jgi:large subunit ribosomal protein L24
MANIRKGDTVQVIAGKDKGTTSERGVKVGGITTVESAIHLSNVMLVDGEGKATRIGARKDEAGKNVRISRRSGKDA